MKKLFDKENFVLSACEGKARKQSIILSILVCFFFVVSAFIFFDALYCFSDIIGSIVSGSADVAIHDLLRSLPIFLTLFMTLWTLLLLHGFYRNVSDERRIRSLKKNAIAILCFAGVNIIYVLTGLISGTYLSLVEGSPSAIFPLDTMLYSLIFIAIGVLALVYYKKGQEKFAFVGPSRGPIVTRGRFGYCLVVTLWMLVALFGFSGFFTGLFVIDFIHGHVFYGFALIFVYLVNFVFIAFWEFYYNQLKPEKRKELLLPLAIAGLILAAVAELLYFVSLGLDLDAPSNMGFGVLPVAFAASVNIATLLVVETPFIVGVVALIKGIVMRRHLSKPEQE